MRKRTSNDPPRELYSEDEDPDNRYFRTPPGRDIRDMERQLQPPPALEPMPPLREIRDTGKADESWSDDELRAWFERNLERLDGFVRYLETLDDLLDTDPSWNELKSASDQVRQLIEQIVKLQGSLETVRPYLEDDTGVL